MSMEKFGFRRDLAEGKYKVSEMFSGLEDIPELKRVFGKDFDKIADVTVCITTEGKWGERLQYAYINDGEVHIGTDYIHTGREDYVYLDIIHELTHIKQHWDGRELFDESFAYVDRPTEIEAYRTAAEAAKRIGMNYEEISSYLEVPWCSKEEMARLERSIDLE